MEPKFRKRPIERKGGKLPTEQRRGLVRWPLRKLGVGVMPKVQKYEDYKKYFGDVLKRDDRVLDLGTGLSNFVDVARKNGINAIGIDADFSWKQIRSEPHVSKTHVVRAIAQELPFPDCHFDAVVTLRGPLHYGNTKSHTGAIVEALRVLKLNGKLEIYPGRVHYGKELPWKIFKDLTAAGFDWKITESGTLSVTKTKNGSLEKLRKMWRL